MVSYSKSYGIRTVIFTSWVIEGQEIEPHDKQIILSELNETIKEIHNNQIIGILICKKENKFVIEYCSDNRIIIRKYNII